MLGIESQWVQHLISIAPEGQVAALWENRDYVGDWLDRYITTLQTWREFLNEQDATHLAAAFAEVQNSAEAVARGEDGTPTPASSELTGFRQMILGSLGRRMQGKR